MAQSLQFSTLIDSEKMAIKPAGSVRFSQRLNKQSKLRVLVSARFPTTRSSNRHSNVDLAVLCSYKNFPGTLCYIFYIAGEKMYNMFSLSITYTSSSDGDK